MKIYVPVIEPATDLSLFATCVTAQELTVQVGTVLHCKFEPQVVVPEPDHPELHVTVTVAPMIPIKESVAALSEFRTSVGAHAWALHVDAVPAAATSESVYLVLQALQST